MKTTTATGLALAALLLGVPVPSSGQVQVSIGISFPEPPPLVVVQPGIRLVPELDEEVFFVSGFYWVRRGDIWYRTADWHGGWQPVRRGWVPPGLMRLPPGRYRYYYRDDDGRWRPHEAGEYHAWRERHSYDERRAWWKEHHHDEQVRWEQQHASRGHRGPEGEDRGPGNGHEHGHGHAREAWGPHRVVATDPLSPGAVRVLREPLGATGTTSRLRPATRS